MLKQQHSALAEVCGIATSRSARHVAVEDTHLQKSSGMPGTSNAAEKQVDATCWKPSAYFSDSSCSICTARCAVPDTNTKLHQSQTQRVYNQLAKHCIGSQDGLYCSRHLAQLVQRHTRAKPAPQQHRCIPCAQHHIFTQTITTSHMSRSLAGPGWVSVLCCRQCVHTKTCTEHSVLLLAMAMQPNRRQPEQASRWW